MELNIIKQLINDINANQQNVRHEIITTENIATNVSNLSNDLVS